ncbi:hypothetical protein C9J85_07115 [Haloferax sp. wsp5]|nr:hypothetical protein C9J85_07115 [Haloferax sp. wsp5]
MRDALSYSVSTGQQCGPEQRHNGDGIPIPGPKADDGAGRSRGSVRRPVRQPRTPDSGLVERYSVRGRDVSGRSADLDRGPFRRSRTSCRSQ